MGIISKQCAECGKIFLSLECQKRKYCGTACRLDALHRETAIKRMTGKIFTCQECGTEYYLALCDIKNNHGTKYCSADCYWKTKRSDDPPCKRMYSSAKWRHFRKEILERDNHECQECGEVENLQVHHKINSSIKETRFDEDNLITLCHDCHNKIHGRFC